MVKFKAKENPDNKEFIEILNEGFQNKAIIIITACCNVSYDGRAKSELGLGDRVLIIKPDGSFLIHKSEKRDPVNWQPPGCTVKYRIKDDSIVIKSIRKRPKETLEVEIPNIYMIMYFLPSDYEKLNLVGSEEDMANLIFYENPEIIENGFKPIAKEKSITDGIIDILGKDKDGNLMVLELKRRKAGLDAVSQLKRYIDTLKVENENLRGVLVAPSITENAMKLLNKYNLEFKEVHPPKKVKKKSNIKLDFFK